MSSSPKQVLIIGGGHAGLLAATQLRKQHATVEITLVEPKDYFELVMFTFRSPFDDETAQGSLVPLQGFVDKQKVKHIQSTVANLDAESRTATLANGGTVTYDVCLVCTGAGYKWSGAGRGPPASHNAATTLQGRRAMLQQEGEKLVNAESVLIIGGGLIGTELAGELAHYKKERGNMSPHAITLVHAGPHVCPEMSVAAAQMTRRKLESRGIVVITNDRVFFDESTGKASLKSTGKEIQASEIVHTTGVTSHTNRFLPAHHKTADGWVETDDFLRVKHGQGRLYAFGDCSTLLPKAAAQLGFAATKVGKNLAMVVKALEQGKAKSADDLVALTLKPIKASPTMVIATVGPDDGVFSSGCFHTQYLLPSLKKISMFSGSKMAELGF